MRLFFSAGEASGDAYAAALLKAILDRVRSTGGYQESSFADSLDLVEAVMAIEDEYGVELSDADVADVRSPEELFDRYGGLGNSSEEQLLTVQAIGGRKVEAAGATLVADSSSWGAIGVTESLRVYPKARQGLARAQRALKAGAPGVFVPIDYGYMNIGLARLAKSLGWKVVYFSPPGAWRKDKQGADLPKVSDAVITPFSWSADMLNGMGADAHWFGHPIKQMIRDAAPSPFSASAEKGEGVEGEGRSRVAILPGSRQSEVRLLLPVFAKALKEFEEQAEIAIAATVNRQALEARWRELAPGRQDVFTADDTYGVLRRARAAIVCSGTATLEAALCRCPHVVVYKVSKAVEAQARLIRFKVPHIAQPNILLERTIVPELIQQAATPEAIAHELKALLADGPMRSRQLEAFEALDRMLGPDDAIDRSAELIAGMLR
jgi:lipid-A-disaccharide synthase